MKKKRVFPKRWLNRYEIEQDVAYLIVYSDNGDVVKCIIDKEDVDRLSKYHWSYNSQGYFNSYINGRHIQLQNFITNNIEGYTCDHINRNTFDNRKCNLRFVTFSENKINNRNRGYTYDNRKKKWTAYITIKYKRIWLGTFDTEREAIAARRAAEEVLFPGIKYYEE